MIYTLYWLLTRQDSGLTVYEVCHYPYIGAWGRERRMLSQLRILVGCFTTLKSQLNPRHFHAEFVMGRSAGFSPNTWDIPSQPHGTKVLYSHDWLQTFS